MKINDKNIEPGIEVIVLPRDSGDVVFKARGLVDKDFEDFRKLCPEPIPPWISEPNKPKRQDVTDLGYKKEFDLWVTYRFQWMYLKSLESTEGLVWETVKPNDPSTWANLELELQQSLSIGEFNRVIKMVRIANALDDTKIEEAKKRFMLQAVKPDQQ